MKVTEITKEMRLSAEVERSIEKSITLAENLERMLYMQMRQHNLDAEITFNAVVHLLDMLLADAPDDLKDTLLPNFRVFIDTASKLIVARANLIVSGHYVKQN